MTTPAELRGQLDALTERMDGWSRGYCFDCNSSTWFWHCECQHCAALRARLAQVEEEKV